MKRVSWIVLLVAVALIAAACGGQTSTTTTDNTASTGGSPADAVRGYMEAAFSGGDVLPFFCGSLTEEQRTQIASAMSTVATSFQQSGATIDLSGVTYTAENETADAATVVVGGVFKVTSAGATQDLPIEGISFPVKNENGWKICQ